MMKVRSAYLLSLVLLAPVCVHAASSFNLTSVNCSSILSVSTTDGLTVGCSGALSLAQGSVFSDGAISIMSDGALSLSNLTITGASVDLRSVNGTLLVDAGTIIVTAGILNLYSGGPAMGAPIVLPTPSIDGGGHVIGISNSPGASGGDLTLTGATSPIPNAPPQSPLAGGAIVIAGSGGITLSDTPSGSGGLVLVSSVPEPRIYAMLLSGLAVLLGVRARRRKQGRLTA